MDWYQTCLGGIKYVLPCPFSVKAKYAFRIPSHSVSQKSHAWRIKRYWATSSIQSQPFYLIFINSANLVESSTYRAVQRNTEVHCESIVTTSIFYPLDASTCCLHLRLQSKRSWKSHSSENLFESQRFRNAEMKRGNDGVSRTWNILQSEVCTNLKESN